MMRWWTDEFDRLREHVRVIKMSALRKGAIEVAPLKSHVH